MRKTLRAVRRSILPAGFALSLASILLLLFSWYQVSSYSQSLANVGAAMPNAVRTLGLGLALIGFAATVAGVVFSRRYRSLKWIALVSAGLFFVLWFVVVLEGT